MTNIPSGRLTEPPHIWEAALALAGLPTTSRRG